MWTLFLHEDKTFVLLSHTPEQQTATGEWHTLVLLPVFTLYFSLLLASALFWCCTGVFSVCFGFFWAVVALWLQGSHWLWHWQVLPPAPTAALGKREVEEEAQLSQHLPKGWEITNCSFWGASCPCLIALKCSWYWDRCEGCTIRVIMGCDPWKRLCDKDGMSKYLFKSWLILPKIDGAVAVRAGEKRVWVWEKGWGEKGGKEGPCGCHLQICSRIRALMWNSCGAVVTSILLPPLEAEPLEAAGRENPWWNKPKQTPRLRFVLRCFNPASAWSGADCKLFPEEILMGSWGLYQFLFETSGTSASFVTVAACSFIMLCV